MKNILITGGAGFIGSHIIKRFINNYPDYNIYNVDSLTYAGNLDNLMEIENKKTSLKNILIRDDIKTHKERLDKSGFLEHEILLKYFNFSSFIAIK